MERLGLSNVVDSHAGKTVTASGSALYKSGMTDCEPYAIGSFFGGVLSVLLAFVVAGIVLRLLNCQMVIQKRTRDDSLHTADDRRGTANGRRSAGERERDVTPGARGGEAPALSEEAVVVASMVGSNASIASSAIINPSRPMDELPTRTTLNLAALGAIHEEDCTGSTSASDVQTSSTDRQSAEGLVAKQQHICPTCRCHTIMGKRLSLGDPARRSRFSSSDQGLVRQSTVSSQNSYWTDETCPCENPGGEYVWGQSLSSQSTNNSTYSNTHRTHQPPGELNGYERNSSSQAPSVELLGVDVLGKSVSSEQHTIILCKHDSIMPPLAVMLGTMDNST